MAHWDLCRPQCTELLHKRAMRGRPVQRGAPMSKGTARRTGGGGGGIAFGCQGG